MAKVWLDLKKLHECWHLWIRKTFNLRLLWVHGMLFSGTGLEHYDTASASHLDLDRAPYGLYGVEYIDLVSLHQDGGQCLTP